jgi:hypothetical protein
VIKKQRRDPDQKQTMAQNRYKKNPKMKKKQNKRRKVSHDSSTSLKEMRK